MSTSQSPDKRLSLLIAATALNSALSLGAIALWFFAPNRTSVVPATTTPMPPPSRPPDQLLAPRRSLGSFEQPNAAPSLVARNWPRENLPTDGLQNRSLQRSGDVKASPSTIALAERLHLLPEGLVQAFGDEAGDIPRDVAQRLDKAYDAAVSLAKQRNLNEAKTQSVTTLLTHHAFRVLQEEKAAAPGPADPTRIEASREQVLNALEMTCGAEVRNAAENLIEGG